MKKNPWNTEKGLLLKNKLHCNKTSIKLQDGHVANFTSEELNAFPIIDSFEIMLKCAGQNLGMHLYFVDTENRYIVAHFPWWDNCEIALSKMTTLDIPLGTMHQPYFDAEQGWQIFIWEKRDDVYIIQGGLDGEEYDVWFKVKKSIYLAEWEKIIE